MTHYHKDQDFENIVEETLSFQKDTQTWRKYLDEVVCEVIVGDTVLCKGFCSFSRNNDIGNQRFGSIYIYIHVYIDSTDCGSLCVCAV